MIPIMLMILFLMLQTVLYLHDTVCAQAWLYQEVWKLRWNEEQGKTVYAAETSPLMAVLRHEKDQIRRQWQSVRQETVWQMELIPEEVLRWRNASSKQWKREVTETLRCPWSFLKMAGAMLEEWKEES